jgi:hypothetical protein
MLSADTNAWNAWLANQAKAPASFDPACLTEIRSLDHFSALGIGISNHPWMAGTFCYLFFFYFSGMRNEVV